tara:strand:+ start:828 stop:1109 length:282 start_codon:yes stop_codon:yes gene_type:complete
MRKKAVNGVVRDMTSEEIASSDSDREAIGYEMAIQDLRIQRNFLLSKTDWTANSDVVMSDAMKTYRQQLRDAPAGLDTIEKVQAYEFPTEVTK